ncbi:dynein axonemal assembly factor 4-like [Culicoides brevitarsis]|uniref:dynein axonemal assembly factor 4-like n=1 Tax=Culicoides brevitarsis TaxID=469753 RepID=UPI00307BC77D
MPILLKDVKWTQTEGEINVDLKFSSKLTKPVDIFTSKHYIKVSSPPYLWEAFLSHEIDTDESRCQLSASLVQFSLKKCESIHWESLEKLQIDNGAKAQIREEAVKEKQESIKKKQKETIKYKEAKKREEIVNSTSRDAKTREDYQKIVNPKKVIEETLSSKIEETKITEKVVENPVESPKEEKKKVEIVPPPIRKPPVEVKKDLPGIRKTSNISISFSNRNFITPKRESQEDEEREWLLKQKDVRKAIGFDEEDLRPEERNPHWLKEKGDHFYQQGNFLGAISAYSTAIRMTDQYWELFMNRAAAHFSAENFQKCAEDCSRAYDLLTPPCEANLQARQNCLARRGAALARMGLIRQGYEEVVAALKLKYDKQLERDAEMLRCKLQNSE